jgi:hypothetical protein
MKRFSNNLKSVVSWCVVVAVLAAVSCSGTAVSPLGGDAEATSSENSFEGYAISIGPIVSPTPPTPREASAPDWGEFDEIVEPELPPWMQELIFDGMHISLTSGENDVDHTDYMYSSDNVTVIPDIGGDRVELASTPAAMSYVTYGFKDIPDGEEILRLEVTGTGAFGTGAGDGLYIGLGDYRRGAIRWVGPYAAEDDWVVNIWFMDNTNDQQRAYLTLAVAGGDTAEIEGLRVFVGGAPDVFHEPILEQVAMEIPLPDPFYELPPGFEELPLGG